MVNVLHQMCVHAMMDMLAKRVNMKRVCHWIEKDGLSLTIILLGDSRLVECYRRTDCSAPSRIGNQTMSMGYCCGNQAGSATASADGTCTPCTATVEEVANATSKGVRTLNYATCVLWGRDHIRTFDGLSYDFQGS